MCRSLQRPQHRARRAWPGVVLALASMAVGPTLADTAAAAYRAMGIPSKDVLSGTSLSAAVIPDRGKQLICLTSYFTGRKDQSQAVNVRLDIFEVSTSGLASLYSRDFGTENGAQVAEGNLQLIDLDMDGVNEIVVSYDNYRDPLIDEETAEVILYGDDGFRTAWRGPLRYDATKAARDIPVERRDRFLRELDIVSTLRSRGLTLFINKRVLAVAGERLATPKTVQESFPLRARPRG